jgi:acyl-CoA thioester hydrolase
MSKFHTYNTKVYYEDTDAGGIVYYARYLHFIERARTEMIYDRFNLSHKKLKSDFDAIFVVRECNVKYHKSANFEDYLEVYTHISKKTPVRLNLIQEVKRGKETLVTAEIELAVIDSNGSISKLPKELLDKM